MAAQKKSGSTKKTTQRSSKSTSKRPATASKKGGIRSFFEGDDSRSRIIRTSLKLLLVLAAVALLVLMWRNRVEWSCANVMQAINDAPYMTGVGSGYPQTVMGSRAMAQDELAGGMAVLTDTNMTVYNTSSKQAISRAHYLTSPGMKTAGRYALLVDIGGTKYRLETVSETLIADKAENTIIGGAVAHNGTFAVITQGSSYNSSMLSSTEVFNRKGETLHKWHSAEYYITDAALSADGKYLAMCGVWARDGELLSCLIMHKVGVEGELAKIELPKTLCLSLEFTNTGTLYAVCDNQLVIVTGHGSEHSSVALDGTLQAYDINHENGAALYTAHVSGDDQGTLTLYDSHGQLRFRKDVPLYGISVSLGEKGCCVLGRGGITAYHLTGESIGTWDAAVSADDILMVDSRAYVIEGISINQIKLN